MRSLLLVSILTACTNDEEPAECRCVDYKVMSAVAFDHLTITWHEDNQRWTEAKDFESTTQVEVTYAHPWAGPTSFEVIAAAQTALVGVGSADLEYVRLGPSNYLASGNLILMP